MKIIQPTTEIQTITLILRRSDVTDTQSEFDSKSKYCTVEDNPCADETVASYQGSGMSMSIYEDGTGKEETVSDLSVYNVGNFDEVSFSSSILRKDFMYVIEITSEGSLLFRGKMYCTDSFDGGVYDKNSEYYKQYPNNDNNYTVL